MTGHGDIVPAVELSGAVIYVVRLPALSPVLETLRHGPVGLGFGSHNLLQCIGASALTLLAGMQHSATPMHKDGGEEAEWSLLLEGQKVWLVGRREDTEALLAEMPAERTMS